MPALNPKPDLNTKLLSRNLKKKSLSSERTLRKNHPIAAEIFVKLGLKPGKIRQHAARLLTSGVLAGTLLLSAHTGTASVLGAQLSEQALTQLTPMAIHAEMATELAAILPPTISPLNSDQEDKISKLMANLYGIKASAMLDGNRLNQSYGRMGAEQHLPRYPGDTVENHGAFLDKGITPGLGAWGYFAYSSEQLTPELEQTEKYYVAVQTLYLPDWNTRTAYLRDWYKYRRVVVINPGNGKAIIAAVADSGPANFTGKQFGGSPEVLAYLGINYGMQNHPVILFFLNDPEKKIPLGPLEYNINKNHE